MDKLTKYLTTKGGAPFTTLENNSFMVESHTTLELLLGSRLKSCSPSQLFQSHSLTASARILVTPMQSSECTTTIVGPHALRHPTPAPLAPLTLTLSRSNQLTCHPDLGRLMPVLEDPDYALTAQRGSTRAHK